MSARGRSPCATCSRAWAAAVLLNLLVWAHHIYLDYPSGTLQAALNTAMQPTTFALVLPSVLSLYSLAFTIYRSDFEWTAASTALFLGLVGWLLAGLSGVVNATIAFNEVVHDTLWVVGHFHHMAFLNIGLAIFGATYAFLPELTGKGSGASGWHVWLTFAAGTAFVYVWLIQGLQGLRAASPSCPRAMTPSRPPPSPSPSYSRSRSSCSPGTSSRPCAGQADPRGGREARNDRPARVRSRARAAPSTGQFLSSAGLATRLPCAAW